MTAGRRGSDPHIPAGTVADLLFDGSPASAAALRHALGDLLDTYGAGASDDRPWSGADAARLAEGMAALAICPDDGLDVEAAISGLGPAVLSHGVRPWAAGTVAHLHSPTLIPAAATEALIGAINQSMDSFDQAPAATLLEDRLVRWLAAAIGLPGTASGVLTAGGTASNTLGLFLARRRAAQRAGVDVDRQGMAAAGGRWRILTSAASHVSVAQAAVLLGVGSDQVIAVATDERGRIDVADLDRRMRAIDDQGATVLAIVGTAGTTDAGAVDPLAALAERAAACGAWLHVDAAVGCALALSDRLRGLLEGIERADSVTADLHKLWWQPISASALLVADGAAFTGMRLRDDYLNRAVDTGGPLNLVTRSLDTSRRFDALKIVVGLRAAGRRRLASSVEHLVDLAAAAAERIRARPALEELCEPSTVTVLFRWAGQGDDGELDRVNTAIQRRLFARGTAILGRTQFGGRVALKLTLVNPRLAVADIDNLLDLVEAEAVEG